MKHFINNPLFASTLLNLKQAEEAQHHETAIPFHCEYPCPALPGSCPALPRLGSAALGRTGTTDPVCFHSQRDNLFSELAWRGSGVGFSSCWINSWLPVPWEKAGNCKGLKSRSSSRARAHRNHPSRNLGVLSIGLQSTPKLPQDRYQCGSHPVQPCTAKGSEEGFLPSNISSDHVHIAVYTLCPRPNR